MTTIKVEGMRCQHCVQSVSKALAAIDGVDSVSVDLEKKEVSFDETKPVDREAVKKAISAIGFEVVS